MRAAAPVATAPVTSYGWTLLCWSSFAERWSALIAEVGRLKAADPARYQLHPATKFLAVLRKIVMETVPSDPAHAQFRLGTTMGDDLKFWRRVKFGGRFRLFFRYQSTERLIVYVWLNDENTLRKAGARSDAYAVFKAMLESHAPPSKWDELRSVSPALPRTEDV